MEKRLWAADLYEYLVSLSASLARAGETSAAEQVTQVSQFVSGSTSELYGEASLLLPRILQDAGGKLPTPERSRLQETIAGIESELKRIGGA